MAQEEGRSAVERGWTWDPTLYAGSASYYSAGRMPPWTASPDLST